MESGIKMIFPQGFFGASDLDTGLDLFLRELSLKVEGGDENWASKYGADFENDVFMMHKYCWCENEGECAWCTGCGIYQDTCEPCKIASIHTDNCYQTVGRQREAEWLKVHPNKRSFESKVWQDLAKERNLSELGCAIHCDCGAEQKAEEMRKTQGCPYHLGTGIFARFQPYIQNRKRNYYDPPNFWYKPLDFRLTWYKYIGRDVATNKDLTEKEFEQMAFDCFSIIDFPEQSPTFE